MNYVSRAGWGARPPKYVNRITDIVEGIFVHYRGPGGAPVGVPAEKAALRQDQAYHMAPPPAGRGWSDIAYSWAVGNTGTIYELRGWGVRGGHTADWNNRSHAVLWIGGDDASPSGAALDSITTVCAEHAARYGGWVKAHRDVNPTSCPGDILAGLVHAGRFTQTTPTPPQEDDMPEPKVLLRGGSAIYLCQGITKVHVPSPDAHRLLQFIGVEDKTQVDSSALLATLGELPTSL